MLFRQAARQLVRRQDAVYSLNVWRAASTTVEQEFESYGKNVFMGAVADEYLKAHGASAALLKDPTWVTHSSDTVAAAVFDWYVTTTRV